jgi:hypothetical protein
LSKTRLNSAAFNNLARFCKRALRIFQGLFTVPDDGGLLHDAPSIPCDHPECGCVLENRVFLRV